MRCTSVDTDGIFAGSIARPPTDGPPSSAPRTPSPVIGFGIGDHPAGGPAGAAGAGGADGAPAGPCGAGAPVAGAGPVGGFTVTDAGMCARVNAWINARAC